MPTYTYRCKKGHVFELFHGIKDETARKCPKCRTLARRVPAGGAGLLFKGSGFYITDYRSRSYTEGAKAEKPAGGSGAGGGASAPGKAGGSAKRGPAGELGSKKSSSGD